MFDECETVTMLSSYVLKSGNYNGLIMVHKKWHVESCVKENSTKKYPTTSSG